VVTGRIEGQGGEGAEEEGGEVRAHGGRGEGTRATGVPR